MLGTATIEVQLSDAILVFVHDSGPEAHAPCSSQTKEYSKETENRNSSHLSREMFLYSCT